MHAIGQISAFYKSIRTGREHKVLEQKNLILYSAADIMAALLSGNMNMRPNYMYFEYENTNGSVLTPATVTRSSGRSTFNSITGVDPISDWLRVPMITTPCLSRIPDNSSNYVNNAVMFNTTSAASASLTGESPAQNYFAASGANGPSIVFAVDLVSAPVPANNQLDVIFSRVNLSTPISMQPGMHLSFYWQLMFN